MTFPDPNLERPLDPARGKPDNAQDVVPPTERGQDPAGDFTEHGLAGEPARPLTDEEREAADPSAVAGQRVYAPASERVPVDPVPGHRDFVEHPDTHTPERESSALSSPRGAVPAAGSGAGASTTPLAEEPSFTRVNRPGSPPTPTPGAYASAMSNPAFNNDRESRSDTRRRRQRIFLGLGFSWASVLLAGVVVWLFLRWRRERNKPINRLRRQALQATAELRERMPPPEEAVRPMGLTTALLSVLVILWQRARAGSRSGDKMVDRASNLVSPDADWQKRLTSLKERWTPRRVELEKVSISRR